MMLNKLSIVVRVVFVIIASMVAFSAQSTMASDPEWREKQQALFEKTGLTPGDIIDKSNWKKIDGLAPPSIVAWVKKGRIDMKIGEYKYDINPDDKFINAGRKNEGKFKLNEKKDKNLVGAATGKPPAWLYGIPFPNLDIKNDPDAAIKIMYNFQLTLLRRGTSKLTSLIEWIGRGGYERDIGTLVLRYNYWGRPEGQVPNKSNLISTTHLIAVSPYDVYGTVQMTVKKTDGTDDDLYVYIPTIRRTKRMSGANRSDPYMGTDATADDTNAWDGRVNSMRWRFVEERVGLFCVSEWGAEEPAKMKKLTNGTWRSLPYEDKEAKFNWEKKDWTEKSEEAPWGPTNVVWIPRTFFVIEALPIDRYYNAGKIIMWIDIGTYWPMHKISFDKAMQYWKTLVFMPVNWVWGENKGPQTVWSIIFVDEKIKHACISTHLGTRHGTKHYQEFEPVDVIPELFTAESLSMWSK